MSDCVESETAFAVFDPSDSITLDEIKKQTSLDNELTLLKSTILKGFPESQHSTNPEIRSYFNAREHLWIENDVVMFKNRIVVPKALRPQVLKSLHCAHQGTESMRSRAAESVYWPGINASIAQTRNNCKFCDSISPSQPRQPLKPLPPSNYPFEFVCADAFEMQGHKYLVVVDKFSSWPIVFYFKNEMRAKHLVESLRQVFETYGAPMRLYSDGGLVFVAQETQMFLNKWGVEHVVSSAHYPPIKWKSRAGCQNSKTHFTPKHIIKWLVEL